MAKYTPRTTAPSTSNKYFIHYTKGGYNTCILISGNSVLPNCVGYAQGRIREILNDKEVWSKVGNLACNAEDWIEVAQKNGFKTGSAPKLGAVIVWSKGKKHNESDGCGHVAVVEKIKANGDIVVSQSAYGGTRWYIKDITKSSGYAYSSSYKFEGFVYCGIEFDNNVDPYTPSGSIVAGQKAVLNNTPCYSSETAKTPYGTKSGTYYLWDTTIRNGRIRITNKSSNVGVAGQVTCWVNVADIGLTTTTTAKPAYQCTYTVKKGDSLWAIATKYLGRGSRYKEIMNLNGLKTDVLSIGQKLKIPNK